VLAQAIAQVEAGPAPQALVFVAATGWHPGVIGIVASRLRERYDLPTLVVALDGESGEGRGSGRSVPGIDLGAAVVAARQAGLLISGGGHPMAAGLTVAGEEVAALQGFLEDRLGHELTRIGYRPALGFDGVLALRGAKAELLHQLESVGPFGAGNPEPRFALARVRLVKADPVGQGHLRCLLAGEDGGRLRAIAFRCQDTPLGAALANHRGLALHLAGRLRADAWAGPDAVQFHIEDAASPGLATS
jgi:single-stranded-DNA-specific exonuclease